MPEAEENESVLLGGKSALSPIEGSTLPETNSLPLKNGGWETTFSFWVSAYFQVLLLLVSARVSLKTSSVTLKAGQETYPMIRS